MEKLPEVLQDKINLHVHELKFTKTLNLINQLFDDDVELIFTDDFNTNEPTDISLSDIELILRILILMLTQTHTS